VVLVLLLTLTETGHKSDTAIKEVVLLLLLLLQVVVLLIHGIPALMVELVLKATLLQKTLPAGAIV
jgi:hypothetical protein